MRTIPLVVISALSLYILGLIVFTVLDRQSPTSQINNLHLEVINDDEIQEEKSDNPIDYDYNFIDSKLANLVLTDLDVFEPLPESYFAGRTPNHSLYDVPFLGLKTNENYCKEHRAFFANNAETLFSDIYIIIQGSTETFVRGKVIPYVATDLQPEVAFHYVNQSLFDIQPGINAFFTWTSFFPFQHVGKHFSCLTQMSNHIPGNTHLSKKSAVAVSLAEYVKQFQDRPSCPVNHKYFLKNWLLSKKEDCQDFFRIINSQQYQESKKEKPIQFMRKVSGMHRGAGVQPVTPEEEDILRANYSNGDLCGENTKNVIIQDYVQNPLLINGRKFDFRFYVLIASTNPMIAYYHDGLLRVSLESYDEAGGEKRSLLTNLALSKDQYEQAENKTQMLEDQMWDFPRFQEYLLKAGVVKDPNWLENYLRPEFKKACIHLLRSVQHKFRKDSSLYEVYGVDFIIDTDMNIWFLEANAGPSWDGDYTQSVERIISTMLKDHFDIVYGLLSSRMKRIVAYVNNMILTGEVQRLGNEEILIPDLEEKRKEFKQLTTNYYEKQFEPEEGNGFSLLIDDNLTGIDRYQGLISEECL